MSRSSSRYAMIPILVTVLVAGVTYLRASQASATEAREALAIHHAACWHDVFSEWHCSDTTMRYSTTDVQSVSITVTMKRGKGRPKTVLLPANTDAIFLSKYSVENMLARYYDASDSTAKKAVALRRAVATRMQQ